MMTRLFAITALSAFLVFPSSAHVRTESLNGEWTLDYWEQGKTPVTMPSQMKDVAYSSIPAMVPGNVELDLYAAGLTENPEIGSNIHFMRQYERYQWRYSRDFLTPSHSEDDDLLLNFKGIDCYAEIFVNGKHVGSADNMLINHEFNVSGFLNPVGNSNHLEVIIRSSIAEEMTHLPPMLSYNWTYKESVYTRRAPHSYGWDIMPRLISAGLWKGVELKVVPPVNIRDVHWFTSNVDVERKKAAVDVDYVTAAPLRDYDGNLAVKVTLSRDGQVKAEKTSPLVKFAGRIDLHLDDAEFWWPRGYGEPSLYDASVCIVDVNGNILDEDVRKIGVRLVRLDRSGVHSDDNPGRFQFYVNNVPIFIHGSNWTPLDAFHSRDTEHLDKAVELAVDLNCNMLRCWGGNVYEDDRFYELCDSNGIMIWQDFSMGCSFYPQDEEFQRALDKEIRSVVRRLRSHPCVALWSGNNEDDEAMTGAATSQFHVNPNRDIVTRNTIPSALLDLDVTRPYLPSSPFWSEEFVENHFGDVSALPERHLWGPRGYYKDPFYTVEAKCIFASETGYHGMPNMESIEKMFPEESRYPWTDKKNFQWKEDWLTKSVREFKELGYTADRNNLMINQVKCLFGEVPSNLADFIFASQSVQAEAMKFFVERFRGNKFDPHTGILWWNIRDGWPVISDAIVDYYFSKKPVYYYLRNVQKNVCAMILDPVNGQHPLVVSNDTRKGCKGEIEVMDVQNGKMICKCPYSVKANGRIVAANIPVTDGQGLYIIRYTGENGEQLTNHYLYGKAPFKLDSYRKWISYVNIDK